MAEESIVCSPSKCNKSIHKRRQERKSKRKESDIFAKITSDLETSKQISTIIKEFYVDSDAESPDITSTKNSAYLAAKSSAVIENFKPFELEKSLLIADHLLVPQLKHTHFPKTQGFVISTSLTEAVLKTKNTNGSNGRKDKNSSCMITDSELIICCSQAEKMLGDNGESVQENATSIVPELTPCESDDMTLANSILIDFSQSPLQKKQSPENSWQYTPEFRLRRLPLKHYSRKVRNVTRSNLNEYFKEHDVRISAEYDDHSSCSSLSMQEDVTICDNMDNQSAIINTSNTERLCENLLNLTEYFTQNESQQFLSEEQQQQHSNINSLNNRLNNYSLLQNVPDLIKDIISLNSSYSIGKHYDSYSSNDDFYGFKNNEDRNHAIGAEQGIEDSNINVTCESSIYDVQFHNEFLNYTDNNFDDFNEDDTNDIFACIGTENILQQLENNFPYSQIQNVVECPVSTMTDNNENALVSETTTQNNTAEFIGFKTASSKPIKVSREAHIAAAKILSKLPDIPTFGQNAHASNCDIKAVNEDANLFENSEDYEWNDDYDLFLNFQTPSTLNEKSESEEGVQQNLHCNLTVLEGPEVPSSSNNNNAITSFKTAGGKDLKISRTAQNSVQKLLQEFNNDIKNDLNFEEELSRMKCKMYAKTHNLETKQLPTTDIEQVNTNLELKTTKKGDHNAKNFINEICMESKQANEDDVESIKKGNEITQPIKTLNRTEGNVYIGGHENTDNFKNIHKTPRPKIEKNVGFNTANGKMITISKKAQIDVQKISAEFNKPINANVLNDLQSIKNNFNNENYKHKVFNDNAGQLNTSGATAKHDIEDNLLNQELNLGFQTAKGKKISISAKAQQTIQKLLEDFDSGLDVEKYENDLFELKNKIQSKYKNINSKTDQEVSKNDMILSEWPSCTNVIPEQTNGKRKKSIDDNVLDSVDSTPPLKMFKNTLKTSKSLLTEQSLKSPLSSATQSIIVRKNLLSLTKRRKKRNSLTISTKEDPKPDIEIIDLNVSAVTPIKSYNSLGPTELTPATPNLQEFLANNPLTSTPEINNQPRTSHTIDDSDLRPIVWENNNDSVKNEMHKTKLSDNSTLNITLNSSNPSAKERIGRLKMYGKAPPVSPILIETHHNCRPSGLRRTRSMFKNTEK